MSTIKTLWIDVETTGLNPHEDSIIELAALFEHGEEKSVFHTYCLPEKIVPESFKKIEELTGITLDFLKKNGISERSLYDGFTQWMSRYISKYDKGDKAIFAAYNARFDNEFIRELFRRNGDPYFGSWFYSAPLDIMSTVTLAFRLGIIQGMKNFKNATIAESLGIELKAHSAIEDIKASRQIQIILEDYLKKLEGAHVN